jgi:hypothetical protein
MASYPLDLSKTVYLAPPHLYSAHTTVSQSFGPIQSAVNVDAARLSPNGYYFAIGCEDGTLKVRKFFNHFGAMCMWIDKYYAYIYIDLCCEYW